MFDDHRKVLGFNILGARFDHNQLENWIAEGRTVDYCIKNLKAAQFDVEFGRVKFEKCSFIHLPL